MPAPQQVLDRTTDSAADAGMEDSRPQPSPRGPIGGRRPGRATARAVGILMLAAFLSYGVGSAIATSIAGSANQDGADPGLLPAALSMLVNSAIVIAIGVLMLPILRRHNRMVATTYLVTRLFEGVGLAVGVVGLLSLTGPSAVGANSLAYNVAMTGLGVGSLFFCALLYRSRLVPRFLAAWGVLGYAAMAAGCILELLGLAGAGIVSVVPGGLFELTFAVWLIARGFAPQAVGAGTENGRR